MEASPKSGASVEAGQTILAADGAEIYYTMSTEEPADPDVTEPEIYGSHRD